MSKQTFQIITPVDNSVYVERPLTDRDTALAGVSRAAEAQRQWRQTSLDERIRILSVAIDNIVAERDEIAGELAWQIGRPVSQGGGEVSGFEERARYMLAQAPTALADVMPGDSKSGYRRYVRREPVGVVFTIAPWNFPYMTAVNSIWPALVAGNAVVLKHAQQTALCGERMARALHKAGLPDGVFQSLHVTHDVAAEMAQYEAVRLVVFTGSVGGGLAVRESVAQGRNFAGIGLELGGKDPAYVRADADIEVAAAGVAEGIFFNAGQSCCSLERVYVHESIHDEFVEALVAEAEKLKLGNPFAADSTLGPVVKTAAAQFVRSQIADAVAAGAKTLVDPARFPADEGNSAYLAPQLLAGVTHGMRIMMEESFGPVAGIMPVASDDEALHLMNDSAFGLTASIWTQDVVAVERLGEQIATGTVFMNGCDGVDPALAWTGVKQTGHGCALSVLGYGQLTQPKSFNLKL